MTDETIHPDEHPINQAEQEPNDEILETSVFQEERDKINDVIKECKKIIVGQSELLELMVACLLSDGHILIEGVPGVAKTLAAKVMSKTIKSDFSRIQFTPDLMPSDIIGTTIFNNRDVNFTFKKGPIFSNIVLIDEINRAPAKTQAALFEVMEEKQITYDGITYPMEQPFLVIATQNPVEQEGTYKLPEAQLDRFLMKINVQYPTFEDELNILNLFKQSIGKVDISDVKGVISYEDIHKIQSAIKSIHAEPQMMEYILKIIHETRNNRNIYLGASPRASLFLLKVSKVVALMQGRNFITPDDVQYIAPHVLNHRIVLTPEAEISGLTVGGLVKSIMKEIEVPR